MKKLFIATLICTYSIFNAQITKGNWMVGGNATMNNYKNETLNSNGTKEVLKSTSIIANPYIGYFPIDKAVFGMTGAIRYDRANLQYQKNYSIDYSFGPFARYYFLKPEKMVNIYAEAGYMYSINKANMRNDILHTNSYNFGAGCNVFLNSSVAIEFMVKQNMIRPKEASNVKVNNLQLGLGLQIFLEK